MSISPAPAYVTVGGYNQPGDGGGGNFYLGPQCADITIGENGDLQSGSTTIHNVASVTNVAVGSLIVGTGIPAGAQISSITTGTSNTITITLPATQTALHSSFSITGDNNGTLIHDSAGTPDCYYKVDYRGDPHEWGAYGNGSNDDTTAMQDWLGAFGIFPAIPSTSVPANFGPYNAHLPGIYEVTTPLICPANANIQAPSNLTAGNVNGGTGAPPVIIAAASNFKGVSAAPGLSAVIVAGDYCRVSGLGIDASSVGSFFFSSPGTTTGGNTVTVTTTPTGVVAGMPISDSMGDIPPGTTVLSKSGTTITISAMESGSHGSNQITVTGFSAVDVVGTHVVIDQHSWLNGGYNDVNCGDVSVSGLQVKDTQIVGAYDEGIHLASGCSNVRLVGTIVSGNGTNIATPPPHGYGVLASGDELTVEGGVIEQSGGVGLQIDAGRQVSVTGMYFDNNGKSPTLGGAGVTIKNSTVISLCSNHFHRNGGDSAGSSQVYFSGTVDSVELCGNVYLADNSTTDLTMRPSYVYDMASGTVLTNSHFHETPGQQVVGLASSSVEPLLQPLQIPQFTKNQIDGLGMSNVGTGTVVSINTGSASDSTSTAIISLNSPCTVDLANNGPGGLDTGSRGSGATYNYFVIASPGSAKGGVANPNCIASASSTPLFSETYFSGTGYLLQVTGYTVAGSAVMNNVSSISGVAPGDAIVSASGSGTALSATTVSSLLTSTVTISSLTWSSGATTIAINPTTNLLVGMQVIDANNGTCFPSGTYIQSITTNTSITISQPTTCSEPGTGQVMASGGNEITLASSAATSTGQVTALISTALYRNVGPLYTDTTTNKYVVPFKQDGNIFYLVDSVFDIPVNCTINSNAHAFLCPLSVPHADKIDAFGRFLGGAVAVGPNQLFISSPDQDDQAPTTFASGNPPGYSTTSATGTTAFPFQIETNSAGKIQVRSSGSTNNVYEATDGWIWRGRY